MVQRGVAPDRVTINAKINHAIIRGNLEEARRIFERVLDGVSKYEICRKACRRWNNDEGTRFAVGEPREYTCAFLNRSSS